MTETQSVEVTTVKECPFCKCAEIGVKDSIIDEGCWAYCTSCKARGPFVRIDPDTPIHIDDDEVMKIAYSAWNTRE